jgi:hypothetical protein
MLARRGIPRRRSPFLRELDLVHVFRCSVTYGVDSASLHFGVSDKGYTATRGRPMAPKRDTAQTQPIEQFSLP